MNDELILETLSCEHEWVNDNTEEVRTASAIDLRSGDWTAHVEGWVFLVGYDDDAHERCFCAYPDGEPEELQYCTETTLRDYIVENTEIEDEPCWDDVAGLY